MNWHDFSEQRKHQWLQDIDLVATLIQGDIILVNNDLAVNVNKSLHSDVKVNHQIKASNSVNAGMTSAGCVEIVLASSSSHAFDYWQHNELAQLDNKAQAASDGVGGYFESDAIDSNKNGRLRVRCLPLEREDLEDGQENKFKLNISGFAKALAWPSGVHFATLCALKNPPLLLNDTMLKLVNLLCDHLQLKLNQESTRVQFISSSLDAPNDADAISRVAPQAMDLQVFIDSLEEHVWIKNTDGVYVFCNRRVEQAWGRSKHDILGRTDLELFDEKIANRFVEGDKLAIAQGGPVIVAECQDRDLQSQSTWLETFKSPAITAEGLLVGVIGITRNIAKHKAAEEQLNLAATVFSNTVEGVVITDRKGFITEVNSAFTKITGYELDEVKGKNPNLLSSGHHDKSFYQKLWNTLLIQGRWQGEIWNRRKNGEVYPQEVIISAVYDDTNTIAYFVAVFTDVSVQRKTQAKLDKLILLDPLTQLPNRTQFMSRIENAIYYAKQEGTQLAVVFIDVDFFKHINDSLGHVVGDNILVELANRLSGILHPGAVLSRLGGDEFSLLTNMLSTENLIAIVNRVYSVFEAPFNCNNNQSIRLTASMGLALYPSDGLDNDCLLRHADAAMHRAKQNGRNNYAFYTEAMTQESVRLLQLQSALHEALEMKRFSLVYQPKVDLNTLETVGFEALIRWNDPNLGNVSPVVFIPIAEKNGLINDIGLWVIREACEQGVRWLKQGKSFHRIAVNVASLQLQRNSFVDDVQQVLRETGLPAKHLEIEVTESCMLQNPTEAIIELKRLREMGITLAMDDFGTGYSSLSYLKKLPINKLKIDRSFIKSIVEDANNAAIAKAVIALGHALNLHIIAEGVETQEQADFLRLNACEQAQGYYFSRPKLPCELDGFLSNSPYVKLP
ncbi:EAL domain-containing protein [Shewanella sp. SR44-3]|uniref:sensor domain-containing protein n=1 Tax=Shewanella sp. SR44-3 TaxID=2760936 RepID=UPI0015FAF57B|nr:EAL domain-containing protein [Shewanella sp. SR44-3]MBB1269594.1 EAL domain-containing protein [Shewanella sp. SR44-3]